MPAPQVVQGVPGFESSSAEPLKQLMQALVSTDDARADLLRSLSSHSGGGEHCIDRWFINQMCRKKPLLLKQRTPLILHRTARAVQTTYYYGFPIVHKTVLVYTSS